MIAKGIAKLQTTTLGEWIPLLLWLLMIASIGVSLEKYDRITAHSLLQGDIILLLELMGFGVILSVVLNLMHRRPLELRGSVMRSAFGSTLAVFISAQVLPWHWYIPGKLLDLGFVEVDLRPLMRNFELLVFVLIAIVTVARDCADFLTRISKS
jgi:hypothetical protein